MPPDGESKGRPLIPEAQRDDWCTPEPVTPYIYKTLGRPVDLDPASNAHSIVQARRAIWWEKLRDDAVELPPGVEWGDGLEALRNVEPGTTVYLNPPFGREEVPEWVEACAIAARRGAEVIALLPSYTSAYWFDHVYQTANAACFWGLPAETNSRLRFLGAPNGAGFACMFAYWGPREERFVSVWAKAGQIWHTRRDRLLTAQLCGLRLPAVPMPDDHRPSGDLFAYAERRLRTARHDALVNSCSDVMHVTLGDLMASEAESLKQQFGELTIGEILNGLSLAAVADSGDRPVRRAKTSSRRRSSAANDNTEDPQIPLDAATSGRKVRTREEIAQFDEQVLTAIWSSGENGISRKELEEKPSFAGTRSQLRDSLKRLRKAGKVRLEGERKKARYHPTGENRHGVTA